MSATPEQRKAILYYYLDGADPQNVLEDEEITEGLTTEDVRGVLEEARQHGQPILFVELTNEGVKFYGRDEPSNLIWSWKGHVRDSRTEFPPTTGGPYQLVRFYLRDKAPEVVQENLSREEARRIARGLESSSTTCKRPKNVRLTKEFGPWFIGFRKDPEWGPCE